MQGATAVLDGVVASLLNMLMVIRLFSPMFALTTAALRRFQLPLYLYYLGLVTTLHTLHTLSTYILLHLIPRSADAYAL